MKRASKRLFFDPIEIESTLPVLENVLAIIITHNHGDHLQPEKVQEIRDRNPEVRILVPSDAVELIDKAEVVSPGDTLDMGNFNLVFFGGEHAAVIPGKVPCQNLGVIVNKSYVNPGGSYDVVELAERPEVLFCASVAPWCRVSETMNYIETTKPKMVVPVHNGLLSDFGNGIYNNLLRQAAEKVDAEFAPLAIGESIEF